jgi:isoleucyl-tRNA synthetase
MAEKKGADFSRPTAESPKSSVALREEATQKWWEENTIFEKSVAKDAPNGEYVFYDGPPFATGLPHYGHIVASVIKDVVPRYWTMRGYSVPRVWGWDCHGLPIENIVEKELGFKHKKDIKEYGVEKFNERCRERVLTYAAEWEKIIPRIGRWADMKNAYRTMDKPFMESVWWAFKQLFDKGLVYEDYRSMHVCPRCETTLSQQEVSEGYKDVKDIAVTVKFKLKNPEKIGLSGDVYILAWTTTPWTLPGNVALAVGSDIEYIDISIQSDTYIVAKEKAGVVEGGAIGKTYKGVDLVGLEYEPLFDYYTNDTTLKNRENGWKVYAADFISAESGTGIAHEAPAFGAEDWELLKQVNLPFVQHVNYDGTMKPEVAAFAGMEVKPRSDDDKVRLGTDIAVLKYLQEHGTFFAKENITHSYPHCWRCDTPLLNYATSSWFVNVTKLKGDMLENAKPISWSPGNIKEGRWGKWLEGARDWSISRQRFWASVMPIWVCEACKKQRVFGSATELEEASGQKIDDLHKHIVDKVTVPCECGSTMHRIPDVLDTWFDSGSMPYGEKHYPFENKERFDSAFPAQFIAEGLDQTRAWFYYMHVLASGIFNKNAFQNVIVNGIVLAEDGKKMSKKLQNYPDPMMVVDKYGADALRYYLLSSPVMQAENLSFVEKDVEDTLRKNIGRLNNVLAFYQLYDDGTARDFKSGNVLDQWILARLSALVGETTLGYEAYKLDEAARPLALFIDDLSVWYLRRSRDRFKEEGADKAAALATLRFVLHTLARVMAPAMPFFSEHLFQAVKEGEDEESVHLANWPTHPQFDFEPAQVLAYMFATRAIVSQALDLRDRAKIKVRQPLNSLTLPEDPLLADEYVAIIRDEVNIKYLLIGNTLEIDTSITDALREEGIVRDTIREIQAFRKDQNLKPGDISIYRYIGEHRAIVEKHRVEVEKATNTTIEFT